MIMYLQEENVLWKTLNWFQEQTLEGETSLTVLEPLFQKRHELGFLLDAILKDLHGTGEVVYIGHIVVNDLLSVELHGGRDRGRGLGRELQT